MKLHMLKHLQAIFDHRQYLSYWTKSYNGGLAESICTTFSVTLCSWGIQRNQFSLLHFVILLSPWPARQTQRSTIKPYWEFVTSGVAGSDSGMFYSSYCSHNRHTNAWEIVEDTCCFCVCSYQTLGWQMHSALITMERVGDSASVERMRLLIDWRHESGGCYCWDYIPGGVLYTNTFRKWLYVDTKAVKLEKWPLFLSGVWLSSDFLWVETSLWSPRCCENSFNVKQGCW